MSFFKTNDAAVLAVITQYHAEIDQLKDAAKTFQSLFSAEKTIVYSDVNGSWFGGLIFKPSKDSRFWTNPDRKDQTQRPRNKVPKMSEDEKSAHKKLLEQWSTQYPNSHPRKEEFYKSIGTNWGNILLGGIGFFVHNETLYIDTNTTLGANVTEILGSEFEAAKVAFQNPAKKEVQS